MMKNIKNILIAGLVCCGISATTTSCRENEFGEVDLDIPEDTYTPIEASYSFASHCAMYTDADFQRVKQSLDNGSAPQVVKDELQNLKNSKYTLLSYTPTPQTKIVRGDPKGTGFDSENYAYAMRDAAAAYQMGMLWRLTGDDRYATKAVEILNAWANTCTEIASNDANQVLAAGAQGNKVQICTVVADVVVDRHGAGVVVDKVDLIVRLQTGIAVEEAACLLAVALGNHGGMEAAALKLAVHHKAAQRGLAGLPKADHERVEVLRGFGRGVKGHGLVRRAQAQHQSGGEL